MLGNIGEIRGFAGNFAPRTWAFCAGQLIAISSNTALFSIIGTTYGGDGRTTFKLPDLRGRIPIGTFTGPGLSPRALGAQGGIEDKVMNTLTLAAHTHFAIVSAGSGTSSFAATTHASSTPTTTNPDGKYYSVDTIGPIYGDTKDVTMAADMVEVTGSGPLPSVVLSPTGNNADINNMMPYLGMNMIICQQGVYPSRS